MARPPMTGDAMDVLYSGTHEIDLAGWERMIHALLTFAKSIYLHASADFASALPDNTKRLLTKTLGQLREANLVRTWRHECDKPLSQQDEVVTEERGLELYAAINDKLTTYRTYKGFSGEDSEGVELTSKIIQFRHELWNIGIANALGVSSLCYSRPTLKGSPVVSSESYRYEAIERRYTETLFKKLSIPPVGFLTADDIVFLRKKAGALRARLASPLEKLLVELPPTDMQIDTTCQTIADELSQQIWGLVKEKSLSRLGVDITKDAAVTSVGLLFPAAALLPFVERLALLLKGNRKWALLFFALNLRERAFRSYSNAVEREGGKIWMKG